MPHRGLWIPNVSCEIPTPNPADIEFTLGVYYNFKPLPTLPVLLTSPKKAQRNNEIRLRYLNGETQPHLAREYGISVQRISQIVNQ